MARITDDPNDLVTAFGSVSAPTAIGDGLFPGQKYFQIGKETEGFRCSIWTWNGTAWECMPTTPILGTGDPNGTIIPDAIGQSFFATDTQNHYFATGLTNNDWMLTN
jgi:hypothetical protein